MENSKNWMDSIEEFLQSSTGLFLSLIMVLAFSTPNTTEVLVKINRLEIENVRLLALSFAIVLEFIILILASIGQAQAARNYAIASFITHLLYYHRWDEILIADFNNPLMASEVITNFAASILTSFMISASIHYFSKQIKIKIDEKKAMQNNAGAMQKNADLLKSNADLMHKNAELEKSIAENCILNAQLEKDIAQGQQNNAKITSELMEVQTRIKLSNEKINTIKRIKAGLSRGVVNEEIKNLIDGINPESNGQ